MSHLRFRSTHAVSLVVLTATMLFGAGCASETEVDAPSDTEQTQTEADALLASQMLPFPSLSERRAMIPSMRSQDVVIPRSMLQFSTFRAARSFREHGTLAQTRRDIVAPGNKVFIGDSGLAVWCVPTGQCKMSVYGDLGAPQAASRLRLVVSKSTDMSLRNFLPSGGGPVSGFVLPGGAGGVTCRRGKTADERPAPADVCIAIAPF